MIPKFLNYLLLAVILSSCSSAYKTSQTPDDVYYSPAEGNYYQEQNVKEEDDNFIRMKTRNNRFRNIDDYSYWNDSRIIFNNCNTSYNYNWGHNWNSYNNIHNTWSYNYYTPTSCNCTCYSNNYNPWVNWNSPYYYFVPYKNPTVYTGNTKGTYVTAYSNTAYNNSNTRTKSIKAGTSSTTSTSGFGGLVKKVFSSGGSGGSNNGSNDSWDRPVRTYGNSGGTTNSGSSSAGGRSGGYKSTGSSSSSSRSGRN